jgi:tRNA (adenine37-N6)-methyltransferase
MDEIKIKIIGFVKEIDKIPVQFDYDVIKNLKSELIIKNEFKEGFIGLKVGQYVDILYFMHNQKEKKILFKPKCNNLNNVEKGVFATRSKSCISAIGVTNVKIIEIKNNSLIVQGLDAFDKSPIIDIKRDAPEYQP